MKIHRFRASGIHGYLTIGIEFAPDLTFLTGNNGSGKSSAVHSIVAPISPSLQMLANIQFREMSLHIEHEGRNITIRAEKKRARNHNLGGWHKGKI